MLSNIFLYYYRNIMIEIIISLTRKLKGAKLNLRRVLLIKLYIKYMTMGTYIYWVQLYGNIDCLT